MVDTLGIAPTLLVLPALTVKIREMTGSSFFPQPKSYPRPYLIELGWKIGGCPGKAKTDVKDASIICANL